MSNFIVPDCRDYVRRDITVRHESDEADDEIYNVIASGDTNALEAQLPKFMALFENEIYSQKISEDSRSCTMYYMVMFSTVAAHCCVESGMSHEQAQALVYMYIRRADKCGDTAKVLTLCEDIAKDLCTRMTDIIERYKMLPAIRKAEDYICDNMHRKITAAEIAEYAGYNRSYLSLLFKRETGLTMQDYITEKRIETAKNMLRLTDYSFLEIAASLSFSTQSYFCRQFKAVTGMTPKEYRQSKDEDF